MSAYTQLIMAKTVQVKMAEKSANRPKHAKNKSILSIKSQAVEL